MGHPKKKLRPMELFRRETSGRYQFLVAEQQFFGPEIRDMAIGYHGQSFTVDVIFDDSAKSIATVVKRAIGDHSFSS